MVAHGITHPSFVKVVLAGMFPAFAAAVALAVFLSSPGHGIAQSTLELCQNEVVVENPQANPGLVGDCAALLASKEVLQGSGSDVMALNWSPDVSIADWTGVTVEESPPRVTKLHLSEINIQGGTEPGHHISRSPQRQYPPGVGRAVRATATASRLQQSERPHTEAVEQTQEPHTIAPQS